MAALLRRSIPRHKPVDPDEAVAGVGTIVAMIKTDEGPVDRPLVRFVVRVDVEGRDPYDATSSAEVPAALLRLLRPGARMAISVDPRDPDAPTLDLSRLWITPSTLASR